jgi:carbon-monoxide dehydrogenase large subunit
VHTGTHSHGQGLDTAFAQIVAERLGIPVAEVDVRHGDTNDLGYGRGTVGARSLLAGGAAIEVALDKIVAKGKRIAAHVFECDAGDVAFERGVFSVAGTDRTIGIREIADRAYYPRGYPLRELEPGLDEGGYWDPTAVALPNGSYVCEVEIDEDTGVVTIVQFVCVDDFGNVVNPMIVEGQVHGGVAQGLGQAAMERVVHDPETGQILSGSLADYALPRADDLPAFTTGYNAHPTATNPLGVKGCGEVGAIGAPAAYVNAVLDALADLGVQHLDMPLTSETVWRAMHERRAA